MAETKKPTTVRVTTTVLGIPAAGLLGLFADKVLERWGVLDEPANQLGDFLRANVSGGDLATFGGFLVALAAYGFLLWRVWRVPNIPQRVLDQANRLATMHQIRRAPSLKQKAPAAPKFEPVPAPAPVDEDGFDYPYRKAVMQARIQRSEGTSEAVAGKSPHRLTIVLVAENKHKKVLFDCSVMLITLTEPNGEIIEVNRPLLNGERFNLDTRRPQHMPILSRDISDEVTPEPFLVRTVGQSIPLRENARYFASLQLRCRYPHPTDLVVQIDTEADLKARAVIVYQGVGKEDE